jgi:hypothetical protein
LPKIAENDIQARDEFRCSAFQFGFFGNFGIPGNFIIPGEVLNLAIFGNFGALGNSSGLPLAQACR